MKKLATLIVACSPALLLAQPTLQQSMVDPNGLLLDIHMVTSPGTATTPSDGANQTWDLSSLGLIPIGTQSFTWASNTPYAASYPTANWSWVQTPTGSSPEYIYLNISASGMDYLADDVPASPNVYTDPKRILAFPMAFNASFTDTYADNGGPATVTWTYSGHGTAVTPFGTYTDVVKLVSDEGDMVLWNTAPLVPLAIDDGSLTVFFEPTNLGLSDAGSTAPLVGYPNPCVDELNVFAEGDSPWRITDLQGRTGNRQIIDSLEGHRIGGGLQAGPGTT